MSTDKTDSVCDLSPPSYEGVDIVELGPEPALKNYLEATAVANGIADQKLEQHMLLSWYDRVP